MGIADSFRVLEPWQRGSGERPLSVKTHIDDIRMLIADLPGDEKPALVGHSWGAMLALAYASEYPDTVGPIALVGNGTFDLQSRARLQKLLSERQNEEFRAKIADLEAEVSDPAERLLKQHALGESIYSYATVHDLEPAPETETPPPFDLRAHTETWEDMKRLQAEGVYPSAFSAIRSPLIMLHGTYDPHPGGMIFDSLRPHLPQLEYKEWERCGHEPWAEKYVREEFLLYLKTWLMNNVA